MYVYKWSQDLMYKNNVFKQERKEKIQNILTISLNKKTTLPLTKCLTLPLRMTTLISKTTPPFCHEWQRVRVSSRHLIGIASISIIIIRSIIVITIIAILRIRSHGRRWWRGSLSSKSAHGRLPSSYATNTNIHLIQLCGECIEASIHALKRERMWVEQNEMELAGKEV